jgi:hypothetical protein
MLEEVTYSNRYKDQIRFEFIGEKTIKVTGYSPYYRMGWPNVYDKAYEAYVAEHAEHGMELVDFDQFKKIVHEYKDEELRLKMRPYAELVYSDQNTIDMWDPSGGPYLHEGHDMREFFYKHKFPEPLIINEFKTQEKGYVLIILK